MPRIILTKTQSNTPVSTFEQNIACKRAHKNSESFKESKNLAKKPKYESISTNFEKMKVSNDDDRIEGYVVPPSKDTNGFAKTFPQRLMDMISYKGSEGIIAWTKEGNAFTINDEDQLSKILLPLFFKKTKFLSFIRKINRWGFKRFLTGENTGAFYHEFFLRDQPERCLYMDSHHSAPDAAMKDNTTETAKVPEPYSPRNPPKNANIICPSIPKLPLNSSLFPSSSVVINGLRLSSGAKDTNAKKELVDKMPLHHQRNNLIDIKNAKKIDSFDARTRRILSNSVLAKSQYQDRIRFRNQLLSKSIAQNAMALGPVRNTITHPRLPSIMTENKKVYTAHDIAAAKLLLSSRQQDKADIHFLTKKLSTNKFPLKKNNVAARLA